jgi:hypothetical protein
MESFLIQSIYQIVSYILIININWKNNRDIQLFFKIHEMRMVNIEDFYSRLFELMNNDKYIIESFITIFIESIKYDIY